MLPIWRKTQDNEFLKRTDFFSPSFLSHVLLRLFLNPNHILEDTRLRNSGNTIYDFSLVSNHSNMTVCHEYAETSFKVIFIHLMLVEILKSSISVARNVNFCE